MFSYTHSLKIYKNEGTKYFHTHGLALRSQKDSIKKSERTCNKFQMILLYLFGFNTL